MQAGNMLREAVEARLSARVPLGIVEALEQTGIARTRLCEAAGVSMDELASPSVRFSRREIYSLCETALGLSEDPALGLHCAARLCLSTFNPLSHLIAHSANLRECLQSFCDFLGLLSDEATFRLVDSEQGVTLRLQCPQADNPVIRRFWSEFCMSGVLRMLSSAGQDASSARWNFAHAAPSYAEQYTGLFVGEVRFDQPFTEVVFDRVQMSAVSPYGDADVHYALRAIAERRMRDSAQRTPFSARVRAHLMQRGVSTDENMDAIARALGMSSRSLRRRLAEEGVHFSAIVSEAKAIVANLYLRERGLSIQEAAYEMGFIDSSAFHRAYKRWTGKTPGAVREAAHRHDRD